MKNFITISFTEEIVWLIIRNFWSIDRIRVRKFSMYYAGDAIYRMINFREIGSRAVRLNDDSFSSPCFHHLFHPLSSQSSEIKYRGRIAVYSNISFSSSSSPFFFFLSSSRHKRVPLLFLSLCSRYFLYPYLQPQTFLSILTNTSCIWKLLSWCPSDLGTDANLSLLCERAAQNELGSKVSIRFLQIYENL